jgi:glycosyltransferase involved in cell wall biosynthesis
MPKIESMKVLLVNIGPSRTGVGNYVKLIMKYSHFSYDLLNVSLFGRTEPSLYPQSPHGKTEHMSVSSGPLQGLLKFYSGAMGRQIAGRVRVMAADTDAVFLSQQDLIHSARAIREQTGRPVVATVHDVGIFRGIVHPYRPFVRSNIRMINDLHFVFFVSRETQEQVKKIVEVRVPSRVVELTVDPDLFRPYGKAQARQKLGLPPEAKIVLSVGKDKYVKNVATVLKSMAYLKGVLLVRVGKLELSRSLYDSLPGSVKSRVIIREGVADELLPYYYSAADVFAFPSLAEGFGLELLESAFCGTPVVTTDRPPMNEILPVGHFVRDPLDPAALAEALSRTIEDGDEVVKGYASLKERFSINRFVSEFEGSMRSAAEATAR